MFAKGIAVIGSTTIDKNIKNDTCLYKIGGATTYCGMTYRRHGLDPYIITNVAKRDGPILDAFHQNKISVNNGKTKKTTHFVNCVKGNERKQRLTLRASPIRENQITPMPGYVGCIHLAPLHPMDIDPRCIKILEDFKLPVFVDVQGYTRRIKDKMVYPGVSRHLSDALRISQIVKANESELRSIYNYYNMSLVELMSRFRIKEFVVTLGEKGGWVKDSKGHEIHYASRPAQSVDDPTGAGDVFFAAYIIDRFFKKRNISDASTYAAKLASRQISGRFIAKNLLALAITE